MHRLHGITSQLRGITPSRGSINRRRVTTIRHRGPIIGLTRVNVGTDVIVSVGTDVIAGATMTIAVADATAGAATTMAVAITTGGVAAGNLSRQ